MFRKKKHSLLEHLSGSTPVESEDDGFEDDFAPLHPNDPHANAAPALQEEIKEEDADTGELPIDVFQTPDDIIIHAFVAGVRPDELNVSISRDLVVIEGTREERQQVVESDYFTRELFWGSFTRTIMLPQEVDVENATAHAKDGLLTITLPKLDRKRQTKLRVRSG